MAKPSVALINATLAGAVSADVSAGVFASSLTILALPK